MQPGQTYGLVSDRCERGFFPRPAKEPSVIPGEYLLAASPVAANADRRTVELEVANTGDRPIQVGSHFHFFEVNRALRFDRPAAFGMRLNIPAGTAVRFESGDTKRITLVELGGSTSIYGLNALTNGPANDSTKPTALERAITDGFIVTP